jgi:hypothetical protein
MGLRGGQIGIKLDPRGEEGVRERGEREGRGGGVEKGEGEKGEREGEKKVREGGGTREREPGR